MLNVILLMGKLPLDACLMLSQGPQQDTCGGSGADQRERVYEEVLKAYNKSYM